MFKLIVCVDNDCGIGMEDGSIPFYNKQDMKNFYKKTVNNIVIMGRKTWDSIGRVPLTSRLSIVLTSEDAIDLHANVKYFSSIDEVIEEYKNDTRDKWVIGGTHIYNEFLARHLISTICLTKYYESTNCDIKFNINKHLKYFVNLFNINARVKPHIDEIVDNEILVKNAIEATTQWRYFYYVHVNEMLKLMQ